MYEQQQTILLKVNTLEDKLAKLSLEPQVIDAPLQAPVVA